MINPDKPLTLKLLFQRLNSFYPLSISLREHLDDVIEIKSIKRHTHLIKSGQIPGYIYFIQIGIIRCYLDAAEKDITMAFLKEGDIVVSMDCFRTQTRSSEYLYTLEDCAVYSLSYADYKKTCEQFPEFNILLLLLQERNYTLMEECLKVFKTLNAQGRYTWLTERLPDLPQRVPAKYLASYIGITEGLLSTIKNRKR